MTNSQATVLQPKRFQFRAFLILCAVGAAVAVPILPLRFLGVPGPDFPDVGQVVTTSKNWLSQVASNFDGSGKSGGKSGDGENPSISSSPAEQVKMLDEAAQQLNKDIQNSPSDPALHNKLGLVYLSLGDVDRACEHFQSAVSLARLSLNALGDKITAFKDAGQTKQASESLLEASQINVQLSAAHSNLARVYERRGEHDKVVAELDLLNREGVLFESTAAQTQPAKPTLVNCKTAQNLARAEALMASGRFQLANEQYRQILADDPNVAMAHHRLGIILAMSNNAALAVDELEIAAKLDPPSPEIQNDLGLAYQAMGLPAQAERAFAHAVALDPRATEAAVNLSNVYASQGKVDSATSVLTQAIQNDPKSAKTHNNLGTLLSLEGKFAPALYEFEKAISLDPGMSSAHYGLGSVLLQTKSYLPAVRELKQALALNPGLTQAQAKIEEAYRKAGRESVSAQAL
jgi:tetratricopeptide (TPR) repeat protein